VLIKKKNYKAKFATEKNKIDKDCFGKKNSKKKNHAGKYCSNS
jgi:hypothetical protein